MKEGKKSPGGHDKMVLKGARATSGSWKAGHVPEPSGQPFHWRRQFSGKQPHSWKLSSQLAAATWRQHYTWHTQQPCRDRACPGLLWYSTNPAMPQCAQQHWFTHLVSSIMWQEAAQGASLCSATPSALLEMLCFESQSPALPIARKGGGTWAVRRLAAWLFSFFLLCGFFCLPHLGPEPWVRVKFDYDSALQTPPKIFTPKRRPAEKRPTWLKLHAHTGILVFLMTCSLPNRASQSAVNAQALYLAIMHPFWLLHVALPMSSVQICRWGGVWIEENRTNKEWRAKIAKDGFMDRIGVVLSLYILTVLFWYFVKPRKWKMLQQQQGLQSYGGTYITVIWEYVLGYLSLYRDAPELKGKKIK